MNKGTNNHYSLLLQDETETDGIGLEEEEEEEAEADMNGIEEEDDDDDDEEAVEDSDEEEIFSSSKHRTLSHEGANLNGQNHLGGHGNEYRLLNNNDADLKAVIDTPITIWTPTPMSPARRACFIASIMFGVLIVATFLWVLPCDVQPCEGEMGLSDRSWAVKIEGMGINQTKLVRRLSGGHNVLLSYYTSNNISGWHTENSTASDGDVWRADQLSTGCNNCGEGDDGEDDAIDIIGDGQCGLLMLDGNLGRENWRIPLRECPVDLQCDLLDVSGDHVPDCLVRGSHSMVFMIEARYGTIMWYLHQHKETEGKAHGDSNPIHSTRPPARLLNPGSAIVIPDVNNDSYGDLLMYGILTQSPQPWNNEYTDSEFWSSETDSHNPNKSLPPINNLVLISGQSGSVLGTPFILKQCQKILTLVLEGQMIHYTCIEVEGEKEPGQIHLTALLNQILGNSAPVDEPVPHENSYGHAFPVHTQRRDPCRVKVYNKGKCPSCQSKIQFFHVDGHIAWDREYEHSGVVSWAALLSNGECHGAIFKIWEYKLTTTVVKTSKPSPVMTRRTTRSSLTNDDGYVETDPTDVGKNGDEQQFTIVMNSNFSESSEIHTLLHKNSVASLKEEYNNNQNGLKPPSTTITDFENSRLRRKFQEETQETPEVYEHPTIHHHHGRQTSGTHEDHGEQLERGSDAWYHHRNYAFHPKQVSTTAAVPSGMRTMPPDVLAPPGYQLQQIHEKISVLRYNGTDWLEETLTSMGIRQLCHNQSNCIPDMKSHCKSVAVVPGVKENAWQLITSSTTFVSNPVSGEEQHLAPWTLTSILRKIIVNV